ncbi:caspase family protein [Methylomonas sp. SURF-1]|uniref:Caspase family protein n=1 Tax=Methylomonas aurea TaxID=2952224 RepID=A0ABT1UFH6_9GAMM|nr:caspase family protein [Methylomonas sp. SURF-1]MCQ8180973.1 caspase family protein [Methylomonas sp. SURF-1]
MRRQVFRSMLAKASGIGRFAAGFGCAVLLAGCTDRMSRAGAMRLADCPVNASRAGDPTEGSTRSAEEQIIVDCELPGIQFEIGDGIFYTSPPRPARTSVWQCRVGGGKQVAFDAANLQQVENVWKGCAETGDKIAQTYLGEFYERVADYTNAAIWYRKAAEQGYSRAQANLGFLLAKGLGVTQDPSASQEWYRKASGLPAQAPATNDSALVTQLRADLAQANRLLDKAQAGLKQQMAEKEALSLQIKQPPAQPDPAEQQRNRQLQQRIVELEQKAQADQAQIAKLQTQIAQTETKLRGQGVAAETLAAPAAGRYFALVIGIDDYAAMDRLQTPVNDANAVAELLRGKFGFASVKLLLNREATRAQIWQALIGLRQQLTENDNLLIYFAGHGQKEDREGFWLPVDADKPPHKYTWISDYEIALNTAWQDMRARHVLIVADSCFSGSLRNTGLISAPQPTVAAGRAASIIELKSSSISRKFLTSGGDEPVLDKGRSNHSVFAAAFIDFLKNYNKPEPVSADAIYGQIEAAVYDQSSRLGHPQRPLYGPIQGAGDADGQFYFRPSLRTAENRALAGLGRY